MTRVLNSDYFGESKKGGLRMWNKLTYDEGGLALHAGCKVIPTPRGEQSMLIVGLSGTGKTTTTFTRQNESKPVQDDFVALYPGGRIVATENGCFAKTFALDPKDEPTIHGAVCKPEAYLENVSMNPDGKVDFFDTGYTQNGRAVFRMEALGWHRDAREVTRVNQLLILNRNENIIPAVARLNREQAAAYFMLGETQGTSAGGKEEAGKFLRVPGTNPFFPLAPRAAGQPLPRAPRQLRLRGLPAQHRPCRRPAGQREQQEGVHPLLERGGQGDRRGHHRVDHGPRLRLRGGQRRCPGIDDLEILQPRRLYERTGRLEEYQTIVDRLRAERRDFLAKYPGLRAEIVNAITV